MHNGQIITLGAVQATITEARMAEGGQGIAHRATIDGDPGKPGLIKDLPDTFRERTRSLVDRNIGALSPFCAAPVAWAEGDAGRVLHISPFVEGVDLEADRPRTFPELLESAHHACCQWAVLEENGLAHGDIGQSNLLIGTDGEVHLIDFDGYASTDPAMPEPDHMGQRLMMAPEIHEGLAKPSIETDRFAFPVWLSWRLFGHHPVLDRASNPRDAETALYAGAWPERDRAFVQGETPIEALGSVIPGLFDQAFSRDPGVRPTADVWRRAFHEAVNNCWIHQCGGAFVRGQSTTHCPHCAEPLPSIEEITPVAPDKQVKIDIASLGLRFALPTEERVPVEIGRDAIKSLPNTVSRRHLEITRHGDKLLLRHIGSGPTLIEIAGDWYRLDSTHWLDLGDMANHSVPLKLADVLCMLEYS